MNAAVPEIRVRPLSYEQRLEPRERDEVTAVVIHCTELPDLDMAREYGEKEQHHGTHTGNSGHFYIDRDGRIEQWVTTERVAHHVRGHNAYTIGIELVNRGRYPHWHDSRHQAFTEPYPDEQVEALLSLLDHLRDEHPRLARIYGHDDLDTARIPASDDASLRVRRKLDPGPMFPWREVIERSGLGAPDHRRQ